MTDITLATIAGQISAYRDSPDRETLNRILDSLATLTAPSQTLAPDEGALARSCLAEFAKVESTWALMVGGLLWENDFRAPTDFMNIWNCARFCGIDRRFSQVDAADFLDIARRLKTRHPSPAAFILLGNVLRHFHQYAGAEDVYLEGTHRFPDNPFIKFRLVDLYLATYKLPQAHQLLNHLRPLYPYAREMMFASPPERIAAIPENLFQPMSCGEKSMVCFVAADPVYMAKYALNFARSVRQCAGDDIHYHFHVICDQASEVSAATFAGLDEVALSSIVTERRVDLSSANPNWRKALFASERFLLLAELLTKYRKPVLVADIDIECLKDPKALLPLLENGDFGYTNFKNTTEAWERYAATALIVKPTDESVAFFSKMAGMLLLTLNTHSQPWFVDQIVLFRLLEEIPHLARGIFLQHILTDSAPPCPLGFFRILHASWEQAQ